MKLIFILVAMFVLIEISAQQIRTDIPDVMQTLPANNFPDNGLYYCGAVAMANNLVWLDKRGYSGLAVSAESEKISVLKTAELLGGNNYLNIPPVGVTPTALLSQTARYIEDCGYTVAETNLWGWKQIEAGKIMNLPKALQDLHDGGIVCLMLGKYGFDNANNTYFSKGFHYVTMAGYTITDSSKSYTLAIQCPSPRSGIEKLIEYTPIKTMKHGTLHIKIPGIFDFNIPATNNWIIKDNLKWKRENELIVIHGYIGLKLVEGDKNE